MAYAFVGAKSNTTNGASITYSPTAGNLLAVFAFTSAGTGGPTASITDNLSSTWSTALATTSLGGPGPWTSAFYLPNCPSGITSVTLSFVGGTPGQTDIMIVEYSGIATSTPFIVEAGVHQLSPGTGTDLVSSGNGNVTSQPACVIGISCNGQGNGGYSAGTGFTARTSTGSVWMKVEDQRVTATGNVAATFTSTRGGTDDFITVMLAFAEPITTIFVAQETGSTGGTGTSVPLAYSSNITVGSSGHLVVRALTSTSFSVADSKGNTWVQRGAVLNDGGNHNLAQFTTDGMIAGATTVTVTCSPSGTSIAIMIREIGFTAGFDTHAEAVQPGFSSTTTDAITSGTATPTFQPGMVSGFGNITIANPPTLAAGTGYTSDASPWGAGSNLTQHRRYTAFTALASTYTASTTASTNAFAFAAFFKETGGAAPVTLLGSIVC